MTVMLATLAAALTASTPCAHHHYTVHDAARGIRATYAGHQPLTRAARRRVRRYERCTSTNRHGHRFLRGLAARQRTALHVRIEDARITPYDGWAIPEQIVMCESRGENLPPNADDASGYYQILGSTWTSNGGPGPVGTDAYLWPKRVQDVVAARIWHGGAGASQWTCSGLVAW